MKGTNKLKANLNKIIILGKQGEKGVLNGKK